MNLTYELAIYLGWAISSVNLVFLFTLSIYYLCFWSMSGKPIDPVPHSDNKTKFAILIAARNESNVIGNIFKSLKEQTYDKDYFDVWAIVESEEDPTCQIALEYGYHYFVRDRLTPDRKTKGFALQECIDFFNRENLKYDAYMIFDADNVVAPNYIEVMNDLRQTGVKVGLGYRNFTNANQNWLTVGGAVLFDYMNQITSRGRSYLFHKATLMGTGYYVDSDIIEEAGGWIFTGMTEDIQLTTYCYQNDIYMRYYPLVFFYDEQASDYKNVHTQHLRWLYGYFQRRKFLKKAGVKRDYHTKSLQNFMKFEFQFGIIPFVIFNVISIILLIACLALASHAVIKGKPVYYYGMIFGLAAWQVFIIYLTFAIPAFLVIFRDNKNLKLTKWNCFVGVTTYIFYFSDFVFAFFDGLFHPSKRTTWSKIEHKGEVTNEDAIKSINNE